MKRLSIIAAAALMLALTGCAQETQALPDEGRAIVLDRQIEGDSDYLIASVEQLCKDADLVAAVTVTETTAEPLAGTLLLKTTAVYTDATVYKGASDADRFTTYGGTMPLKDYLALHPELDSSAYSKDELKNGLARISRTKAHIPESGDRILFFAEYNAEQGRWETLGEEAVFLIDGENAVLEGLAVGTDGWTPPIAEDLMQYGAEKTQTDNSLTVTCSWQQLEDAVKGFCG